MIRLYETVLLGPPPRRPTHGIIHPACGLAGGGGGGPGRGHSGSARTTVQVTVVILPPWG